MKITDQIIQQARSGNNAWTAESLRHLGIQYPLKKGWQQEIKKGEYTQDQINGFINGRTIYSKRTKKKGNTPIINKPSITVNVIMWKSFIKNNYHNHDLNTPIGRNNLYREYVRYCPSKNLIPIGVEQAMRTIEELVYIE